MTPGTNKLQRARRIAMRKYMEMKKNNTKCFGILQMRLEETTLEALSFLLLMNAPDLEGVT
jgi:hypothetical protein